MYCSQCGKWIKDGARFCPACGCPVNPKRTRKEAPKQNEEKEPQEYVSHVYKDAAREFSFHASSAEGEQSADTATEVENLPDAAAQTQTTPQSSQRRKKAVRCIIGAVLIVGILISGLWGIREYQYRDAISSAESALANRQFEEAIGHLDQALALHPSVAETYLLKATAYVEQGELYAAKQTLEEGVAATQDESLQNVSIWGPVPVVEMAMWANESLPLTRQEYYFSDLGAVQGYVNICGNIFAVMTYYFDSAGNISSTNRKDYRTNFTGSPGINRTLWETCGPLKYPMIFERSAVWEANYTYDNSGNLVSAATSWNSSIINIEVFQNTDGHIVLTDSKEQTTIQYDTTGRPTQILFDDGAGYTISYEENGESVTRSLDEDYWFESNSDGLFMVCAGEDGGTFTLELDEQKRIIQVLTNSGRYENSYSEDGFLEEITEYDSQGTISYSTLFRYDEKRRLIEIQRSIRNESGVEAGISYQMEYDQDDRLVKLTTITPHNGVISEILLEYQQDGKLKYYIESTYFDAEDYKLIVKPVYDEYGLIVDFISERVE